MVRRLALVSIVSAALAWCASPAAAAERPGAVLWTQSFYASTLGGIAATPEGGLIAAGDPLLFPYEPEDTWVRAFRPDGSPDQNFGDGGTVTFRDGRGVDDVFVQPDGRILIVASAPALIRRLTSTGQPDPSFGTDGLTEPRVETADYATLESVALQPDGRLVLGWSRGDRSIVVSRLLADGSPDTGFGSGGQAVFSPGADTAAPDVELQPDGGIVIVASGGPGILIGRLRSNGATDPSFGGGAGLTPLQSPRPELTARLGIYPVPVVVPGGRIRIAAAFTPRGRRVERSSLIGLTADGHPDRRFGDRGLAVGGPALRLPNDLGYLGGEAPSRLVVDDRGGMLMVSRMSTSRDDLVSEARTTIRRFRPDGTLDRSFGRKGGVRLTGTFAAHTVIEHMVALESDRLVVGEHSWDGKYDGRTSHRATLTALYAGYDTRGPTVSIKTGCRWARVRVHEEGGLDRVVIRAGRRVVGRTTRKPQRFRVRPGMRVSVVAVDLAGNVTRVGTTVPPC